MATTSDKEFADAERSDSVLVMVLGSTLEQATIRLVLIFVIFCTVAASLISLVSLVG